MTAEQKQIEVITKFWVSSLPTVEPPTLSLIKLWLKQYDHDLEVICYGLDEAARKNRKVHDMTTADVVKFASMCQIGYAARDPRRKTFRLSDQKPPRNRIEEGGPTFPLAASLADKLGDVPPGLPVTMAMFQRCLHRLADIKAGRVQRPTPATPTASQNDQRGNDGL